MNRLFIICLIFIIFISLYISLLTKSSDKEGFDDNRSSLNKTINAIYYINLNKREDRNEEFLDNFPSIDESRITRISGHYYPENGAVGCLMSHITALNTALKDNKGENILICEDDFNIKDMEYCNKMLDFLFYNIPEWNVIMLGQNTIYSEDTEFKTENNEKIIRILNSQTTSGYLIKKSYISRLLAIYENDLSNYIKTGEWGNYYVDQSWKVLQKKDKWYAFSPTVAVQRPSYSDIQGGHIGIEV